MEIFTALFRTLFFYFFIVLSYRLMGKREIGELGVIDLIVSILIAELVAISIENIHDSLILTLLPISVLVLLEITLAFLSLKCKTFRRIFDGKPSVIIKSGHINYKEMIKQRYTLDDLLLELRQKSIKSIKDVEYAILEQNGKLSIFKYSLIKQKSSYPLPLIMDGEIETSSLKVLKKDKNWLLQKLKERELLLSDVFYAFYEKKSIYIINKSSIFN